MGLPPWETSDGQLFALITGANSGLGFSIAARIMEEFLTSPFTSPHKHLILILCTRAPLKTRFTISNLRGRLRKLLEYSPFADGLRKKAAALGAEYKWQDLVNRVHFLGVEADLCDLKSVYALADKLVNGTIGSPDATTMDGLKLPHGSPGTQSYSKDIQQDTWALSQKPGSTGTQRSWGWGLSGIRIPRLDIIVLNAGIGDWLGVAWLTATKHLLTDFVDGLTWPSFKIPNSGAIAKPQLRSGESQSSVSDEKKDEPRLGAVFCSNVFGHYLLAHELMPLLSRPASPSAKSGGKIVWMSSVEACEASLLSTDDIQGLECKQPYEASKRLADILALTADLPSVQRISASFFSPSDSLSKTKDDPQTLVKPRMFVTHPGIFVSEIMPMNFFLVAIYRFLFYVARWVGSPWHTIVPWKAAVAPTWLALTDDETLEEMGGARVKWGSATDASGAERVMKTDVPGWGWDGTIESGGMRLGRRKTAVDVTRESREEFEVQGAECWRQMEELRREWEGILEVKSGR